MNLITPFGATGSSSCLTSSKRWKSPSAPTRKAIAGKKASSELYAICWARPTQSSFMKPAKLRLNAVSHSVGFSFSGELGACPAVASRSVAVDKTEAAELCLCLALPSAPEDQPSGRADASRQQEAHTERADHNHREVRAQLGSDVRRLADLFAKRLSGAGKLFPLRLDVAANLLECPVVVTGHRASTPRS